jgi:hypothetical protein
VIRSRPSPDERRRVTSWCWRDHNIRAINRQRAALIRRAELNRELKAGRIDVIQHSVRMSTVNGALGLPLFDDWTTK